MPRANRYFLVNQVWHLTHRCHEKTFPLKFARNRGRYLRRCLVYIDLNMVRAGAVKHPAEWPHSGYCEIQQPPERYAVVDMAASRALCGYSEVRRFQAAHQFARQK